MLLLFGWSTQPWFPEPMVILELMIQTNSKDCHWYVVWPGLSWSMKPIVSLQAMTLQGLLLKSGKFMFIRRQNKCEFWKASWGLKVQAQFRGESQRSLPGLQSRLKSNLLRRNDLRWLKEVPYKKQKPARWEKAREKISMWVLCASGWLKLGAFKTPFPQNGLYKGAVESSFRQGQRCLNWITNVPWDSFLSTEFKVISKDCSAINISTGCLLSPHPRMEVVLLFHQDNSQKTVLAV